MDCKNKEQEIRILLQKYFEAATSLSEEAELKDYFSTQANLPADLLYARDWFAYLSDTARRLSSEPTFGSDDASPLDAQFVDAATANEDLRAGSKRIRFWLWPAISVAAAIAGLLLLTRPVQDRQPEIIYGYVNGIPLTDSKMAAYESQKALYIMQKEVFKSARYLNKLDQLDQSLNKSLLYLSGLDNVNH